MSRFFSCKCGIRPNSSERIVCSVCGMTNENTLGQAVAEHAAPDMFGELSKSFKYTDAKKSPYYIDPTAHAELLERIKPPEKTASDAKLLLGEVRWQGRKLGIGTQYRVDAQFHEVRGEGSCYPRAIGVQKTAWLELLHDPTDVIGLYAANGLSGLLEIECRKMNGTTPIHTRANLTPTQIVETFDRDAPPGTWRVYFEMA